MKKDITKTNQKSYMQPSNESPQLMKVLRTGICTTENYRC